VAAIPQALLTSFQEQWGMPASCIATQQEGVISRAACDHLRNTYELWRLGCA